MVPGLHLTLGIFLKLFKVFDQACRRLDYRLTHNNDNDEEIEKVMNELFFQEEKVFNFRESLAACTEMYICQLSQLEENDVESREILQETFKEHQEKVESMIAKLVR